MGLAENPDHSAHAKWSGVIAVMAIIFKIFEFSFLYFEYVTASVSIALEYFSCRVQSK